MWTADIVQEDERERRYIVNERATPMTYRAVVTAWQIDDDFKRWFNSELAAVPYRAFRWETPGITLSTAGRRFEFVVLASPELDRQPNPSAFREHFDRSRGTDVAMFSNLGGDAVMVVPQPVGSDSAYGHIGAFVRSAPEAQRLNLWRLVGEAMDRRLDQRPVWLSTAGAGVAWLHVRLDDRPKYYGYAPFRVAP